MDSHQVRERILVMDNEQAVLHLLERVLSREGYQVTAMNSSEEAVSLMSTEHFDLVIMDVGLRNLNGSELMEKVRETSPDTSVVVMTSYPAQEVIRFAHEHAQGYLEKPFDLQRFLATVRSALEETLKYLGEERLDKVIHSPWTNGGSRWIPLE
jgi:two-component system nitrogen regulation response regulator NtrX